MTSSGRRRRVALAQVEQCADVEANIDRCREAVARAADAGADVVAFAELAHLPFFPQAARGRVPTEWAETIPGPTIERLSEIARARRIAIVYNLYEHDGARTFDASPVIDSDGSLRGVTRMAHVADFEGFHEKRYYAEPDAGARVVDTAIGRVGVAICYDRHFPEYMRALGLRGAEVVFIPQAGLAGEWSDGLVEAEVRTAAFQNGYYAALVNRVGRDGAHEFGGESFVCDPTGSVIARAAAGAPDLVIADVDLASIDRSPARRCFMPDRRPALYRELAEETRGDGPR
jgi:N-carbamoylputrescine amidase